MAKNKVQVIETGVFASPATGADSPYELTQDKAGQLSVRCTDSGSEFDVSVLATPTQSEVEDQQRAFYRELAAWLCTNGPQDPQREAVAIYEVAQTLQAEYSAPELLADQEWITSHDLSKRIKILRNGLLETDRLKIVEFAARIASAGRGVSETDATFIEVLGKGLGLNSEVVTNTVVYAIQNPTAA